MYWTASLNPVVKDLFHYPIFIVLLCSFLPQVRPKVSISPRKSQPLQHHNLLTCSVTGFYPGKIKVRWFWNGKEETYGLMSSELIQKGNWTCQILVMLEIILQQRDVYTCQVKLASLLSPIIVEWSERHPLVMPSPLLPPITASGNASVCPVSPFLLS
uniref:Ig-like domain-containing protein n=1 Tax=Vombatus ursinus TaxID=29139 RepID=A0A4X2KF29_VOMUR